MNIKLLQDTINFKQNKKNFKSSDQKIIEDQLRDKIKTEKSKYNFERIIDWVNNSN